MSIKTEIRIIEQRLIEIKNTKFTKGTSYWVNTGATQWELSDWENAARSSTGDTSMLYQTITDDLPTGRTYKIEYQVIRNSGETITPYFADQSGTTRSISGKYTDYISLPTGTTITDSLIGFIPSSNFDGGVTDVQVYYYDYDEYGIQLYDDLSYNLNFQVFDIENLEKRASSYSKTIKIPGTSRNNQIFNNLYDIDIETFEELYIGSEITDVFFNKKIECELLYDSIPIKEGFFELQKAYYNESTRMIEYEGQFYSKSTSFTETVGDKLLRGNSEINDDLDFSEYDHILNMDNFVASHSGTYYDNSIGYYYPIIDYVNIEKYNFTDIESFRPCLYVKEIIDKIFEDAGYTYSSTFFDSDRFKKLILPWVGDVKIDEDELEKRNIKVSMNDIAGNSTDYTGDGAVLWGDGTEYAYRDFYSDSPAGSNMGKSSPSWNPYGPKIKNIPLDKDSPDPYFNSLNDDFNTTNHYWNVPAKGRYRINWSSGQNIYLIPTRSGGPYYGSSYLFISGDRCIDVRLQLYKVEPGQKPQLLAEQKSLQFVNTSVGVRDVWIPAWQQTISWSGTLLKDTKVYPAIYVNNYNVWYDVNGQEGYQVRAWMDVMSSRGFGQDFEVIAEPGFTLYEGEVVEMNKALPPSMKQIDFFKNIVNMFNLVVDEYPETDNKLYIETREDYYNSGATLDWTDKEDISQPSEIERIPVLINKDFSILYQDDSDDLNELYQDENRELIYGNKFVKNPYLSNDTHEIEIDGFSPTPLGLLGFTNWAVSKIFKTDNSGKVTESEFNSRILYRQNILARDISAVPEGYLLPFYIVHSGTSSTSFGYSPFHNGTDYMYQPYAGHLDNPYNEDFDLNFDTCNNYYYPYLSNYLTSNNLYNLYWESYIDELMNLNSKRVTKYLKLNISDLYNFSFASKIWIDGVQYIVEKINDWNPNSITKVELLKLSKHTFDTSTKADYERNIKYKKKLPIRKTIESSVINIQQGHNMNIRLYDSGTTTGYVSGGTSDFDMNNFSGSTYADYVDRTNKYADGAYGIIIGDSNEVNNSDIFIKGDHNIVATGATNISLFSSRNTIDQNTSNIFITGSDNTIRSGATNINIFSDGVTIDKDVSNVIVLFNDESGKTITTSNYVYIPSGYTIEGYYTKSETDTKFQSTGSTIDWENITNTPSSLSGYSITDAFTKTESDERYALRYGVYDYYSKTTQSYSSADEYIIGDTYNGTGRTITLSTEYSEMPGKMYYILDEEGNASSNNIVIDTEGTETINGGNTYTINTDYGFLIVYSNGKDWFTIGRKF